MQLWNKKGFLLLDSLLVVFITSLVCVTCYSIYHLIVKYEDGYIEYQTRTNYEYENIYKSLYECEACEIDDSN